MTRRVPSPRVYVAVGSPSNLDETVRAKLESLGVAVIPLSRACQADGLVIVPPGWRPPSGCEAPIVEGPPSPAALADYLAVSGLDWAGSGEPPWRDPRERARVVVEVLGSMKRDAGIPRRIPGRPPPVMVASEVYADSDKYDPAREAETRIGMGADAVVIGAIGGRGARAALELVSKFSRSHLVGFDYWDEGLQAEAVEAGASLILSLTPDRLEGIPRRLRGMAWYVIVPSNPRAPWRERVEELKRAASRARSLGYSRIILDPILNPPVYPGSLEGLLAAKALANECPHDVPVMLGLNNFYELIDADSTGVIAALAALSVEAGVSVILVGEESYKARGATLEARLAADMASLAARWHTPPKDVGVMLLAAKQKRPYP